MKTIYKIEGNKLLYNKWLDISKRKIRKVAWTITFDKDLELDQEQLNHWYKDTLAQIDMTKQDLQNQIDDYEATLKQIVRYIKTGECDEIF